MSEPENTVCAALCAAIDVGDDTALTLLADWLEEQGDPRAEGLREVAVLWPRTEPRKRNNGWFWETFPRAGWVQRIEGWRWPADVTWGPHPTRSDAYLALAEALIASSSAR